MTPQDHSREQLSAWMDGELDADAERFLLRRLEHDDALQAQAGRWQLAGDVLKGLRVAPAPEGFARRIREAVAVDGHGVVTAHAGPAAAASHGNGRWMRWGGGLAMAAALGLVALGVRHQSMRPDSANPRAASATAVSTNHAPVAPATTPAEVPMVTPATVVDATHAVASSDTQAESVPAAPARPVKRRAALSAHRAHAAVVSGNGTRLARTDDSRSMQASPDPFRVTTPESSPAWPRAILPGAGGAGAFNASFGMPQGGVFTPVPSLQPEHVRGE